MRAPHPSPDALVRLECVQKVFRARSAETHALSDMSRPSGCGKFTLLSILGLLDAPTAGEGAPPLLLADEPTGNLDSANGNAVMDLLGDLHSEGATIILFTHDPCYADRAGRTLHILDGRIVRRNDARDPRKA